MKSHSTFPRSFLVGDGVTGVLQVELPGVGDHRRTSLTNVTSSPLYCFVLGFFVFKGGTKEREKKKKKNPTELQPLLCRVAEV